MSGQGMQAWSLADMFTLLANQVREQKSWAGTVTWNRQPAVPVEGDEPLVYTVVSVSYADGDEGVVTRVVGIEPVADADPVHLSEPVLREAATNLRAQTIRDRMVNDIARTNVMLGTDEVHDLADHGMFHVEHLLAEIEGLNARLAAVSRETEPTDWVKFAQDATSGDPERIKDHLPPEWRHLVSRETEQS